MFEATSAAAGAVSVYDSPIYIADAGAVPDGDPARPRDHQPVRARPGRSSTPRSRCSSTQKGLAGQYWSLYTDQQAALEGGTALAGTTWQVIVNLAQANGAKIDAVKPVEGATGWSDTWMISSKAAHPNCMYMWMDWIISPGGQRRRWPSGSARRRRTPRAAT